MSSFDGRAVEVVLICECAIRYRRSEPLESGSSIRGMSPLRVERPTSLPAYLELIEQLQATASHSVWYRGCGKSTDQLTPTLYRHPRIKRASEFADMERQLMTRFRQRSIPFHNRSLVDDWETLFFMQHYGVPTRLLDWTENPLIALHFALMSGPHRMTKRGTASFSANAAVWVLDPVAWNQHALRHQSFDGGTLTPGDEPLKSYKPPAEFDNMNSSAVALYGAHNSARIVAQQGVFVIFGKTIVPMEKLFRSDTFPATALVKIVIERQYIASIRSTLLKHGITEAVVFPDLEGLAREIKRLFGFEV